MTRVGGTSEVKVYRRRHMYGRSMKYMWTMSSYVAGDPGFTMPCLLIQAHQPRMLAMGAPRPGIRSESSTRLKCHTNDMELTGTSSIHYGRVIKLLTEQVPSFKGHDFILCERGLILAFVLTVFEVSRSLPKSCSPRRLPLPPLGGAQLRSTSI